MTVDGPFVFGQCVVCDAGLPTVRKGNRPRKLCDDPACKSEYASYTRRRAAVRHRTAPLPDTRKCNGCRRRLPLNLEHFASVGKTPEGRPRYQGTCKRCRNRRARARYRKNAAYRERQRAKAAEQHAEHKRRMAEDPDYATAVRDHEAKKRRQWRRENPEDAREARRAYDARVAADPKRLQARRENSRIRRRLRAEAAGRSMESLNRVRSVRERDEAHSRMGRLPARELGEAIERRRGGEDLETFAQGLGTTARTIYAWLPREGQDGETLPPERELVQFDVADAILTALGLHPWDVWSDGDVLALWAE